MRRALALLLFAFASSAFAQGRIASDFEIAQMREQIARSRTFASQVSGHLNLGDLYATRNDRTTAIREYRTALDIATGQRTGARRDGDLARYGTATSLAALAQAKLGNGPLAFSLAEEASRYASDSADFWNLYASSMTILGKPAKAIAAARNAVHIAASDLARDATVARRLDLAVFQYSLASALIDAGQPAEGERLLREVTAALRSGAFDPLRREIARSESFEIHSTTQGDAAAYLSLLNRAQLRLAGALERRGDTAGARGQYESVLETRTDDATALAALARLSRDARLFAAAFDANPFSLPLVREYQRFLQSGGGADDDTRTTAGGEMRRALERMHRGEMRAARASIDALLEEFPANETLRTLRRETEASGSVPTFASGTAQPGELKTLVRLLLDDRLTPEQRTALDRATLQSVVTFSTAGPGAAGQTVLESGTVDGVPFRFSEPTIFSGTFTSGVPLRLTYRVLGATTVGSADGLLLEPLGLEAAP